MQFLNEKTNFCSSLTTLPIFYKNVHLHKHALFIYKSVFHTEIENDYNIGFRFSEQLQDLKES